MKNKILFLALIILLVVPINVFAKETTGNIIIDCSKNSISIGEKMTCDIVGKSKKGVGAANYQVEVEGNLKIVSYDKNDDWEGIVDDKHSAVYWDKTGVKEATFGTVTIEAVDNGASISKLIITKSEYSETDGIEFVTDDGLEVLSDVEKTIDIAGSKSISKSPLIPIGITVGVVVVGAVVILLAKKKK